MIHFQHLSSKYPVFKVASENSQKYYNELLMSERTEQQLNKSTNKLKTSWQVISEHTQNKQVTSIF